jgi:deazaflavin-dependent oxidoreductase (nitroreductase family)
MTKRRVSTFLSAKVFNRLVLLATRWGIPTPGVVVLETTGRRSGEPRRVPVTRLLEGDTRWIVTEHGRKAAYVKNIQANPNVRVRTGRRWRAGVARLLPDEDWRAIQRRLPSKLSSATVRLMGTEHLTIRVDLGAAQRPAGPAPS